MRGKKSSGSQPSLGGSAASGEVMTQPNVDFRSELTGHAGGLRSLALRLVSPGDAGDLTHDAMVTALS
ncbi:MAG: hypothetical protein KUG77_27555, partial [Nannocystaceae bacterium]|nr:hypothetical protein [Nannocystaceae bacterium]